ncbi:hypothetical protein GTY20_05015 [Streptomyces sp. SID4946]|uniref:hypothetical protein n=1 Tax=Streptomyces sp. LamerLS-31b TaxID=1839765 RepID=UPI00114CE5B8|nr:MULTISPECIES: hypothetical protein [unclassified Streptomyces]MYQ90741.1 hypothetical protein [Streptomyces sp. SID4946]
MDAGLAGVLGALAGSVSAAGVAFIGGWYTREVAQIGARSEHLKERWDTREARYKNFLLILESAEAQLEKIAGLLLSQQSISVELEAFIDQVKPIETARIEVMLAAPTDLHEPAQLATDIVVFVRERLEDHKTALTLMSNSPFPVGAVEVRRLGERLVHAWEQLKLAKSAFEARVVLDLQDFGFRR